MGITVISSPVAVIASNAGLPASDNAAVLATDGIAIDFAALLTGQLSGNEQLFAAATTSAATKDQATTRERPAQEDQERDIISEMLFAQDAAPSNQTIIPYIPPAVENRLPPDVDRSTSPNLKLKSEFTNDLPGTGDKGINQAISSFEQKATLSFEQKTTSVSGAPPATRNLHWLRQALSHRAKRQFLPAKPMPAIALYRHSPQSWRDKPLILSVPSPARRAIRQALVRHCRTTGGLRILASVLSGLQKMISRLPRSTYLRLNWGQFR